MLAPEHSVVGGGASRIQSYRMRSTTTKGIKVALAYIDHESRQRCAISAKRLGKSLSLYNGRRTLCSEKVECEGVQMVKFLVSSCPSSRTSFAKKGRLLAR